MCNRNTRQKIHDTRKTWVINNFVEYKNIETTQYSDYYDRNVKDSYSGVFNPPCCPLNAAEKEEKQSYQEDDIDVHYRDIANKYTNIMKMHQKEDDEISYHSEDDSEYSQELGYTSMTEISDYDDYEDYDDYDDDAYYEDDYDY